MLHLDSLRICCLVVTLGSAAMALVGPSDGADWRIDPDPPQLGKDLKVTYSPEIPISDEASYQLDDGPVIRVKLVKAPHFTIPAEKLIGKSRLRLNGDDSEAGRGYRVVKLPKGR